jgi:radical SAM superfamily enzyme YgiQ (UPF0313 family)
MRVLLVTPPMVQFNTAYAATPALTAFLRREGVDTVQADWSLDLALRLFSRHGMEEVLSALRSEAVPPGPKRTTRKPKSPSVDFFLAHAPRYLDTLDDVMRFLQGRAPELTERIAAGRWLPRGPRFRLLRDLRAFGLDPALTAPGLYPLLLASLYLDDLADVVREGVDPRFGLSRYAERLTASAPSFDALNRAVRARPSLVDRMVREVVVETLDRVRPDVVGITVPFPGNLYGALRSARCIREHSPGVRIAVGGGFISTELRSLADPAFYDFVDYVIYDDGEIPLLRLVEHLAGRAPRESLVRTRTRDTAPSAPSGAGAAAAQLRHRDRPAPVYDGLTLDRYCRVVETPNPMNRLWTEEKWLKLQLAHGCYWRRCAFCDTGLDYIARYDPADADTVLGWIREMVAATGLTGFHFVDEAAPPALLRRLAERLIATRTRIRWWTNIRFDRAFTPELARLLARSGCVAVTGGLECAEGDLLRKMGKGVTLPQAARVSRAFASAGVLVHAYLMYGFPGQTEQQTVDALEAVRQLFQAGCLQSAYWHRFALTVHSAVYRAPGDFGVRIPKRRPPRFGENEVPFTDGSGANADELGEALHKAVYNFMYGVGLDEEVRFWFATPVPAPRLARNAVRGWIENEG